MKLLSHFAPVFPVDDIDKTIEYYQEVLGFETTFKMDGYAVIKRDDAVQIHFTRREDDFKPSKSHNSLYIFSHDVDALYAELKANGANITNELTTWDYGMRDFDILDINGYTLSFGQGVSESN